MPHSVADRLGDGIRLLVDLLQHERLESGLLGPLVVPIELHGLVVDDGAVDVPERHAVARDGDDLAVGRKLHGPRLPEERRRIRGEEVLVDTEPDDQRDLVASADEEARVLGVDHDEGEVPFELGERSPHGFGEIALVVALDEVRDGLGVGLRGERVTFRTQARRQLAVVLHDAVQHDRELRRLTSGQRMCVRLRHAAVRRPARVAEAGSRRGRVRPGAFDEVAKRADGTDVLELAVLEQGDS